MAHEAWRVWSVLKRPNQPFAYAGVLRSGLLRMTRGIVHRMKHSLGDATH